MGLVCKSGRMGLSIRENGKIIELMEKENLFMLTRMSMKVHGQMIKQMDEVFIDIKMERLMMAIGKMIYSMEWE